MIAVRLLIAAGAVLTFAGGVAWAAEKKGAPPLRVHMISGSKEYQSEKSLKAFKQFLEKNYRVVCTLTLTTDRSKELPGLEALERADLLLVFCRRLEVGKKDLARIRKWCAAGKPVGGVRTASHAFQNWLEFGEAVLGSDHQSHGGREPIAIKVETKAKADPVLAGVKEWTRPSKLYRNPAVAKDAVVLLTGASAKEKQPVAWRRIYDKQKGGRSFYTSLGIPGDFENANFRRLLVNAISWTAGRELLKLKVKS